MATSTFIRVVFSMIVATVIFTATYSHGGKRQKAVGWIGLSEDTPEKDCAERAQKILQGLDMHRFDNGGNVWAFRPQHKAGQSNLKAVPGGQLEDLRKQGYVKGPEAYSCPCGGVFHIFFGALFCTKHGLLPFVFNNTQPEYIQAKADSPGIIEEGGTLVFFWDRSCIFGYSNYDPPSFLQLSGPQVYWDISNNSYRYYEGQIVDTVRIVRENGRVYLRHGNDRNDSLDVTSHPCRERMLELLKPILETNEFYSHFSQRRRGSTY